MADIGNQEYVNQLVQSDVNALAALNAMEDVNGMARHAAGCTAVVGAGEDVYTTERELPVIDEIESELIN
jgi:hypothetical protein